MEIWICMNKKSTLRVVLVTAPAKSAQSLARKLLEQRLIACANLLPGATSLYWWEGKIQRDAESLLLLKTTAARIPALLKHLKHLHPYSVPEFLALPVQETNPDYAKWVEKETTR